MNERRYSYYDAVADHLLDGHVEQAKGVLNAVSALFDAVQSQILVDAVRSHKPTLSWVDSPDGRQDSETLILHHTEDFRARLFPIYAPNSDIVKLGTCPCDEDPCYFTLFQPCSHCMWVGEPALWSVEIEKYGAHKHHRSGDWTIGWHAVGWDTIGAFPSRAVAKRFAEELLVMVNKGKADKESIKELVREFHKLDS